MDITPLFKASIKTVRLRNKSIAPDKNRILKNSCKDPFTIKVKDICHQITQLRNLLIDNRSAYMRFACHLKNAAHMSDEDRNIIDGESEKIIEICSQFIDNLRLECRQSKRNESHQLSNHKIAILDLLTDYLKSVFNIYNEQKTYRIQYELDTYKLLKLESNKKLIPIVPAKDRKVSHITDQGNVDGWDHYDDSNFQSEPSIDGWSVNDIEPDDADGKQLKPKDVAIDQDSASKYAIIDEEITAEDIQMFESENNQLFNELKGLSEEVEQIERNVVDIARLQEIFTEKVTIQKTDIERIANVVVGTTENVKDANKQITQAIQRNAGLRVWALFFLIVMSFSLLFLDWYND